MLNKKNRPARFCTEPCRAQKTNPKMRLLGVFSVSPALLKSPGRIISSHICLGRNCQNRIYYFAYQLTEQTDTLDCKRIRSDHLDQQGVTVNQLTVIHIRQSDRNKRKKVGNLIYGSSKAVASCSHVSHAPCKCSFKIGIVTQYMRYYAAVTLF